mgnify:CR=1 FL=1
MEQATPTIWDTITSVITNVISLLGKVCEALMSNQLFQIVLGIVMFSILVGIVFSLVKRIKKRG